MAKYRRALEPEEDLIEAAEEQQIEAQPLDAEEETFKKRYGDLRRHTQQLLQQKDEELSKVAAQLETAAKGQIRFPKTDEEIEQWSKKYPDVARIVDTIARKRANEALEENDKRLEGLRNLETKLSRKEAEQQLLSFHPDFADIRQDPEFHDWVALQPTSIQDALYKNNTDAKAAARAIDLYKVDTGKRKTTNKKSAAEVVGRTSSRAPAPTGKMRFSESQVAQMSAKEFEKFEEAIMESMQNGSFNYDMSGAAR